MQHFRFTLLMVLLAVASCAQVQFFDVAVTDDGSQVYFSTSLRIFSEASQNLPAGSAIYRIANGVVERVTTPLPRPQTHHWYSEGNPQVSADGRVFSYTQYTNCDGGSACMFYPPTSSSFLRMDGAASRQVAGAAQISRNGRFVFNYLPPPYPYAPCCTTSSPTGLIALLDLQIGTASQPPRPPADKRQAITSQGTALLLNPLTLWTQQSSQNPATAESATWAIVNDLETWIVYQTQGSRAALRAFEIATGRDVLLGGGGSWVSISNDASIILYVAQPGPGRPAQAWMIHPDGSGRYQLTDFPQGVSEAVLSGDGQTAIAVTGGRIVSINVTTRAFRELIAATPTCYSTTPLVPGSLNRLSGTSLAASPQTASAALPTELAGTQVLMNGSALPLLSVFPTEIWFQTPFETVPGTTARITLSYASPFDGCSFEIRISERFPYFFFDKNGVIFIHQGFSGLVSRQSPAQPGEVVTVYALGLGSVNPSLTTGIPTPPDQLYLLNSPFECYQGAYGDGPQLDVPFVGLAPGLIGVYQTNIRMPDSLPSGGWFWLNCGTPGNRG